ncbi:SDR family NAD(P)-dependent oxidoreductase [Euzebya tangerina]|uniref:SDR family NAD(P)-dependent oxidoreductase n=1 Tax=Euzebya tangerina TaxID=591198 RepID=UPI000E322CFA|nr:SDR family NAD(P)-dependent oxidoreductase [Euzebya tangerina]
MSDLDTRTVLVAGGTGQVGEPIVRQLLDDGATVVVPSRRPEKARELLPSNAHVMEGDLSDPASAGAVRESITSQGLSPTDVIASLGSWWSGPDIGHLDPEEWDRVLAMGLGAHFHTANTFLPLLENTADATYTLINGGGGVDPVPGSGAVSISAAAQLMLGRVLAQQDGPPRVTTLVAMTPVLTRDRPEGRGGWLRAETIATITSRIVGGATLDEVTYLTNEPSAAGLLSSME